jgi:hypothetical protein
MLTPQIDRLDPIAGQWIAGIFSFRGVRIKEGDGIGGIDYDAIVPGRQFPQCLL